jgi:hypothetical protein
MAEAAEMIGVTERTSRWWRVRYDTGGVEGGIDGWAGPPPGRRRWMTPLATCGLNSDSHMHHSNRLPAFANRSCSSA